MDNNIESYTELDLLKLERLRLLEQKIAAMKDNGIAYYRPHPRQDNFHRAADRKWRLWEAGNRSGKSTAGAAEDVSMCLGFRPFYPVGDPARTAGIPDVTNRKGLIVCNDIKKVGEVFTSQRGQGGKLWEMFPRGFARGVHTTDGVIDVIECANGATLHFVTVRAWMNNPGCIESTDYHFAHIDEPIPKKMFIGVKRGLVDHDGSGYFTLTPKSEPWIHYMFYTSRKKKQDIVVEGRKWAQTGSTTDNPYLPKTAIVDFMEGMTKDEIDCMIHGVPLALSGLVYKEFDYTKHVISEPLEGWNNLWTPSPNSAIYVAIDPHPQTPHHVMFMAALPHDVLYCYDEIFLHCSIPELAVKIMQKVEGRFHVLTVCDPYAWLEHPNRKVNSYAEDFAEAGLLLCKASKDRSAGILETKRLLSQPDRLLFSEKLEVTIEEFETHCWDEKENKPKDENDHAMENLGRLALEKPIWIDPHKKAVVISEAVMTDPDYTLDPMDYTIDSELPDL